MVIPTLADGNATITVNSQSVANGSATNVPLAVGSNCITVVVTAQDGTTQKTYTITATRASSNNADLSNLTLNQGTLTPGFAAGTTSYTASVANGVSSIKVTPTLSDNNASIKVNGTTATNNNAVTIPLAAGDNSISLVVTAQDGTTQKAYTVTVTRAALSSNANLGSLTLNPGSLTPGFSSTTKDYTTAVPYDSTSIGVTPIVEDPSATLTVNGHSVANGTLITVDGLSVGPNTITVVVMAQDGTTQTYTVTVSRASSSNADLSNITLSQGTLDPVFDAATTSYSLNEDYTQTSVDVTPLTVQGIKP